MVKSRPWSRKKPEIFSAKHEFLRLQSVFSPVLRSEEMARTWARAGHFGSAMRLALVSANCYREMKQRNPACSAAYEQAAVECEANAVGFAALTGDIDRVMLKGEQFSLPF